MRDCFKKKGFLTTTEDGHRSGDPVAIWEPGWVQRTHWKTRPTCPARPVFVEKGPLEKAGHTARSLAGCLGRLPVVSLQADTGNGGEHVTATPQPDTVRVC